MPMHRAASMGNSKVVDCSTFSFKDQLMCIGPVILVFLFVDQIVYINPRLAFISFELNYRATEELRANKVNRANALSPQRLE